MKKNEVLQACTICGMPMEDKGIVLKRVKHECPKCGYSELELNQIDKSINYGTMDDEIIKQMARDLRYKSFYQISEEEE